MVLSVCDHFHGTHSFVIEGTNTLNQVHENSMQSTELSSTRKGKRKAEPQEDIDVCAILSGYDTELTCPMYVYRLQFSISFLRHYFRKAVVICCRLNTLKIRLRHRRTYLWTL